MTNWTDGYIADIGYTFGYYNELNPLRVKLAFLNAGLEMPSIGTACELGFGQGISLNIHAAATTTTWYGTDFNPSQVAFAQELASIAGSDLKVFDDSFLEFSNRDDVPEFDYIGLHGIWSWINNDNRTVVVDFIRRKLKVGGVLYISYNTLPGWASFMPVRHLMTEHASKMTASATGIVGKVEGALAFIEKLVSTNSLFIRANPAIADRIKKIKPQSRHYLAHEYFNKDWKPFHFSEIATLLSEAKLDYACSAHYLDNIPSINLNTEQQQLLTTIQDKVFQETFKDYLVNQNFRRDYWVKGLRKKPLLEQLEQARLQKFILTTCRQDISLEVTGALGKSNMSPDIYNPILNFMADHKVRTIAQIEAHVSAEGIRLPQVLQAVSVLVGVGYAHPAMDDASAKCKKQIANMNSHLINKSRGSEDIAYLSSPVTGGGIPVSRFEQLFLLAISAGKKHPDDWGNFVWEILNAQSQKILKDGQPLKTSEENIAELSSRAQSFSKKQLPILKSLQIL
jgi:SAM-dependent methyltransferase